MIVLVTGGRNYAVDDDGETFDVMQSLGSLHGISLVIHGGNPGVGDCAEAWTELHEVPCLRCPCGITDIRQNAAMLAFALKIADPAEVLLVAFPGGPGTADMTERCRAAGIAIMEVN